MRLPNQHAGAALLIFLIILVLGVSALLLSTLNQTQQLLEEDAKTQQVLAQAKEALIGYAVNFYDGSTGSTGNYDGSTTGNYGFLPCPDVDESDPASWPEGASHGNGCSNKYKNQLGRLPWRTLGIPPLRDGAGECLWYAVSGLYKGASTAKADMLNEDSSGYFQVAVANGEGNSEVIVGATPSTRAAAIIIAPGKSLRNQNRTTLATGTEICGGNYVPSNYLETTLTSFASAPDQIDEFLTAQDILAQDDSKTHPVNDKIVYITPQEVWEAVRKRGEFYKNMKCLTQIAAHCVANYVTSHPNFVGGDRRLPWAAPLALADYRNDNKYDDETNLLAGRLPNRLDSSNSAIAKTTPTHLLVKVAAGESRCNFNSIASNQLTECSSLLKKITNCDPNSTDRKKIIWCDAAKAAPPPPPEPFEDFEYSYFYLEAFNKKCNQPTNTTSSTEEDDTITFTEGTSLTEAEKTQCDTIKQINSSNRAVKIFPILWQNWKDHLFYAVADAYQPSASAIPVACDNTRCLQFDGKYCAAIIMFAGPALSQLNQTRLSPPTDSDDKANPVNYLEGNNAASIISANGSGTYTKQQKSDSVFNDILYCIEAP